MIIAKLVKILFYYDGPQVFTAQDETGKIYLATAIEPESYINRYLFSQINENTLSELIDGKRDLLSSVTGQSFEMPFYFGKEDKDGNYILYEQKGKIGNCGQLPEKGFFLGN